MNTWPADHKGPMLVYMANCGDSCDNFDGSGNVWFKVSSEGLIDAASFYWGSDKLIGKETRGLKSSRRISRLANT
ncbi:glycoside hydrolase family 61 protein [Rhizoctonia solani AG-3 Rhs1AP]|uniref:lytic cellulose monooxygenase (C4-dehydrogenating) n=1 Tax=Rhizoctonia solani AG-3 Rhs1AP TaxID=1086054 RepID=X8JAW6_9AGAM|nr:glycoside hydrolase family 61 protein [Rhizoctonia solani AG-3 Rhs1AP]